MAAESFHTADETQRHLSAAQVEAFYHDIFVAEQVRHFVELAPGRGAGLDVVDVGGGCGYFARHAMQDSSARVRVLDADPASVAACRAAGVEAEQGDALSLRSDLRADVASFNLILHHLVAASEPATRSLQQQALAAWRDRARVLFVNEYVYESYLPGASGRLIYAITSSRLLSALASAVARWVPSLRANTFGVGVRFRSHAEWERLFERAGWRVAERRLGTPEGVSTARRMLLIKTIRRDSFLLVATPRP